ncbi:hypothetical protein DUI87_15878 [Hirundo rustica rustica]|uniref:Uncharacterized protein n=1 Tax=Hirundo rustica rustica TaxID=333673 RepID=A0A3M0K567_HIRRU|nr:hypothetical protein DUI87_15878 [Hirundo rustica rustica]
MEAAFGRQCEAKLCSQVSTSKETEIFGTPRVAKLPGKAGLSSQQHLLLMAVVSPAQGQQTIGKSIAYMEMTVAFGDELRKSCKARVKFGAGGEEWLIGSSAAEVDRVTESSLGLGLKSGKLRGLLVPGQTEKRKQIHQTKRMPVNELGIPLQVPCPEACQDGWLQPHMELVPTQRNFPLELNGRETVKVKGQDKPVGTSSIQQCSITTSPAEQWQQIDALSGTHHTFALCSAGTSVTHELLEWTRAFVLGRLGGNVIPETS